MITAIDSSVLLAIYKGEKNGAEWMEILIRLRKTSRLVVCDIVVAETRPAVASDQAHAKLLEKLGIQFLPTTFATSCRAGMIYKEYRDSGGKKERLLADFLVGTHALEQADQLATEDAGFMRKHFTSLSLVAH